MDAPFHSITFWASYIVRTTSDKDVRASLEIVTDKKYFLEKIQLKNLQDRKNYW